MVFEISQIKSFFNKKFLIQIYFIFFILLNIVDFLNIIPNDLDFFKKLLSWTLIGYVFYKVSITKILIGKRVKNYDLGFILAFSLMSIVRSLVLYLKTNIINSETFPVFNLILNFFPSDSNFIIITFVVGLFLTLVLSIMLLINYEIRENSFLGSFNFNNEYFRIFLNHILGFIFLIFFSLIVFNFFMEWFALAVDSVILVFGIIYYLFVYISRHMTNKMSFLLSDISNSGNEFYYNLIEKFSNKKTFFIGVSFLLAIHLIVDIGVYLVPYFLGTQNALYFDSLSSAGRSHESLFGLFDFTNSLLFKDLGFVNGDWFLGFGVFLIYFSNYFMILSLMVLPFYIFYKNIKQGKINFNKIFSVLFLSVLFFNLVFFFLPTVNSPLKMDVPNVMSIKGVDFYTQSIGENINSFELLSSVLIFFVILGFLLFRFEKYKFYFEKLILFVILIFFIYYIFLFFTSSIQKDLLDLKGDVLSKLEGMDMTTDYNNINDFRLSEKSFNRIHKFHVDKMQIYMDVFSDVDLKNKSYQHNDYLYFELSEIPYDKYALIVNTLDNLFFEDYTSIKITKNFNKNKDEYYAIYFLEDNINLIYSLGVNKLTITQSNRLIDSELIKIVENIIILEPISIIKNEEIKNETYLNKINLYLAHLKILFFAMFYVFGGVAFSWYFFRKNIL